MGSNKLDDKCLESLGELIVESSTLSLINLNSNLITDAGIETLSPSIMGNVILKELELNGNPGITTASFPLLIEMVSKSYLNLMLFAEGAFDHKQLTELRNCLNVPEDQREIPTTSGAKSAAKTS